MKGAARAYANLFRINQFLQSISGCYKSKYALELATFVEHRLDNSLDMALGTLCAWYESQGRWINSQDHDYDPKDLAFSELIEGLCR